MSEGIEYTDEQRRQFLQSLVVQSKVPRDVRKEEYEKYKSEQKVPFELFIKYINEILVVLKEYRIVSDFTKFFARIKALDSALKNDESKALNDVFGIEIDCATEGEVAFIGSYLKSLLNITKEVVHNKTNGYKAHHYSGFAFPPKVSELSSKLTEILNQEQLIPETLMEEYENSLPEIRKEKITDERKQLLNEYFRNFTQNLKIYSNAILNRLTPNGKLENLLSDLEQIETNYLTNLNEANISEECYPIIEIQLKTIQVAIEAKLGAADHGVYKGLSPEEIQRQYDNLGFLPDSSLPILYVSNLERDKFGKIIPPEECDSEMTPRLLYPTLVTRKPKELIDYEKY